MDSVELAKMLKESAKKKKRKQFKLFPIIPVFSDVERLVYGMYPDEEYRKFLEYKVLTKDYSKLKK